jgi:oxygen-independent coproporphyrinogen-3 oxidase
MKVTVLPGATAPSALLEADLIRRLGQSGPRYTSYPTADRFDDAFGYRDYLLAIASMKTRGMRNPLSLYLHIPFCDSDCYFCTCNKIVTKNRSKAVTYLRYLKQEIDMQGRLLAGMNQVEQLHLGGGTPTYLSHAQMGDLLQHLRRWFVFAPDAVGEYSIEVDPRTVSRERVQRLRDQGFNRISLGVQDFDPNVQQAVNRVQPECQTLAIIDAAREAGYRSVGIDLIYGLPKQNVMSMARTLTKLIRAAPNRISIYYYTHLPHLFNMQRQMAQEDISGPDSRLDMMALCMKRLTEAGYVYIGMDHFALSTDDLAVAQRQGRLHRNFQGYATHAEFDLVSFGISAISAVGATYSQNAKTLNGYYDAIDNKKLPIVSGFSLQMDDLLRRLIIQRLMCDFELSIVSVETAYPITFASYFEQELNQLDELAQLGLLTIDDEWLCVTMKGRLLIRNICMVFDRYLYHRSKPASNLN